MRKHVILLAIHSFALGALIVMTISRPAWLPGVGRVAITATDVIAVGCNLIGAVGRFILIVRNLDA